MKFVVGGSTDVKFQGVAIKTIVFVFSETSLSSQSLVVVVVVY